MLKLVEAENTVKQARLVVKRSQDAVHGGEMELEDLRALPTSQETNSDIEFLEDELATLKRIAVGAAGDFYDAKRQLKAATLAAKDAEFSVGQAEDAYLIEKRDLSAVEERITVAHRAFDEVKTRLEALVGEMPAEQRSALTQSLEPAVNSDFMLVNIDAEHLQTIRDESYSVKQIQFLAQALRAEAKYKQFAVATGDRRFLDKGARKKERFLSEIDRLAAEKFDAEQRGTSAFGIASHPDGKSENTQK